MPSLPSPEPAISCFDNLDFFKDFENEFPAILYNDALTSKSDLLTEPILNPQHVNEFDLKNETSLSEYDEEEQNVLYFNDLFPFNVIHPNDLKSDEDNDDNEIDIIQSSEGNLNTHMMLLCFIMNLYVPFGIPFDPKRYYKDGDCTLMLLRPRYQGLEYTDADISDFEERLERIYSREIHRVQVVDFQGMPELMRDGLFARMVMEHRDDAGGARRRLSWRQFILALGLHTGEEMESLGFASISTDGDFLRPLPSYTLIKDPMLRLCHRMMAHSIARRSQAPEKVTMTDLFYLRGLDVGSVNIPYLLARYLRRFAAGRKSMAHISGGQFIARLAEHFGPLTAEILGVLIVIAPELPIFDMGELVRLQICMEVDDTWAWVAMRPERQPDAASGAHRVAQDAPIVDEGGHADLAPAHAAPPQPAISRNMP
ncbi:hypothetical protein Tco_1038951 [Tanacetum coccineum]